MIMTIILYDVHYICIFFLCVKLQKMMLCTVSVCDILPYVFPADFNFTEERNVFMRECVCMCDLSLKAGQRIWICYWLNQRAASCTEPHCFTLNIRGSCCGNLSPWGQVSALGFCNKMNLYLHPPLSPLLWFLFSLSFFLWTFVMKWISLFRIWVSLPLFPPHTTHPPLYDLA